MGFLRKTAYFLIVVFLFCLFIIAGRNKVAEMLIGLSIDRVGGTDYHVAKVDIDLNEVKLGEASFRMGDHAAFKTLTIHNLSLKYSVSKLLKGRIDTVEIDQLEIVLAEKKKESAPFSLNRLQLPEKIWNLDLPFKHLAINKLLIRNIHHSLDQLQSSLDLVQEAKQIQLTLDSSSGNKPPFLIRVRLLPNQYLYCDVYEGHNGVSPLLQIKLHQENTKTKANWKIVGPEFLELARLYGVNLPENVFIGQLVGSGSFVFNNASTSSLQISSHLDKFTWKNVKAGSGQISLSIEVLEQEGKRNITFQDGSSVHLGQLMTNNIKIGEFKAFISPVVLIDRVGFHLKTGQEDSFEVKNISLGSLQVDKIRIEPHFSVTRSVGKGIDLLLLRHFAIQVDSLQIGQDILPMITARLQKDSALSLSPLFGNIISEEQRWIFETGELKRKDIQVMPGPLQITLNPLHIKLGTENRVEGTAQISELSVLKKPFQVAFAGIDLTYKVSLKNIQLSGTGAWQSVPGEILFSLQHGFSGKSGRAIVSLAQPLVFGENDVSVEKLLGSWPFEYKLSSGVLDLSSLFTWDKGGSFHMQAALEVRDGAGAYKALGFEGLNFDHTFTLAPEIYSYKSGKISVDTINAGIEVNNLEALFELQKTKRGRYPLLAVDNLFASLFGGSVQANNIYYNLEKRISNFDLQLDNIDLAKVIELHKIKGLNATGLVDGSFPVQISGKQVRIENGSLTSAVQGGLIEYISSPLAVTSSSLTGLVKKALEEFHYNILQAKVNYAPDGMLSLDMHLEGKSPKLETSRPVHLNVNAEQNVLSLLKSLQYTEGVTKELDRKVQEYYNKKKQ